MWRACFAGCAKRPWGFRTFERACLPRLQRVAAYLSAGLALLQEGCFAAHYVGQQAVGQVRLLRIRRHVSDVLADPTTDDALRNRLAKVMAARAFGIEVLGLRGGAEFTRYVDPGGPVAYNLTVSPKDSLSVRSFRFPLVGSVPYLGFFDPKDAKRAAQHFAEAGFDVYLRPVGAYSTLGYLISPVYRSMLALSAAQSKSAPRPKARASPNETPDASDAGELRAVETILHEMAHSTVFLPGASDLNESFATMVGTRGAALFFEHQGDSEKSQRVFSLAKQADEDEKAFSAWLKPQLERLQKFYRRAVQVKLPRTQVLAQRESIFEDIRQSYRQTFPEGRRYRRLADGPLSNALLGSFAVYHEHSDVQEQLLALCNGNLREFVNLYREARDRTDGTTWLRRLAALQRRTVP